MAQSGESLPFAGEVRELTAAEEEKVNLRMQAAFARSVQKHPYLAMALYSMVRIRSDGLGTFATDQYWRFYYDPLRVLEWEVNEISGAILHEIRHCLHRHHERWVEMKQPPPLSALHNWATDALINESLLREAVKLPSNPVTINTLKETFDCHVDESMSSEMIYYELLKKLKEHAKEGSCSCPDDADSNGGGFPCPEHVGNGEGGGNGVASGNCGSVTDGQQRPYEKPNMGDDKGISSSRAENIRTKTAVEIQKHQRSRGDVSADLARWAEEILNPKVDWRKELASLVRRNTAKLSGMKDYSYSRPSRRASVLKSTGSGVILPAMRKPEPPKVSIVVDTSGSMSADDLSWCLAEINGVLESVRSSSRKVPVFACDANVGSAKRVRKASEIELVGGGGTDMTIGIKAAIGLSGEAKPDIVIVLTDGYTPWPQEPLRGVKLIVALTDTGSEADVPPWAKTVCIER